MMLLTEDEAQMKRCCGPDGCGKRVVLDVIRFGDMEVKPIHGRRCIASECMAWRKDQDGEYDKHGNLPGYCGLAGKVE